MTAIIKLKDKNAQAMALKRWSKISKEERSKIMTKVSHSRRKKKKKVIHR